MTGCFEATEVFRHHCPHLMTESARSVLERIQLQCPFWIRALVGIRSTFLKPFGFREITEESFSILEEGPDQLILAFKDNFFSSNIHLRIERNLKQITVTNHLVFFNKMGEQYFKLTKPVHTLICKRLLNNL